MSREGSQNHALLLAQCLIELSKLHYCRVWKTNNGLARLDDRVAYFGLKGAADITGIVHNRHSSHGIRIEFEVKTGQGRQSKQQKLFEAMINKLGGAYREIRSVEDAIRYVEEIHNRN